MELEPEKYELSYLLTPSTAEEAVTDSAQKIASAIESEKGLISHSEVPRKLRLAYSVKKETHAYFGWIRFTAIPAALDAIRKNLKPDKQLLRFLIVLDTIPAMRISRMPQRAAPGIAPATAPKREEEAAEKLDLEALDKKLEEILGK